jgi:hypothetical protein
MLLAKDADGSPKAVIQVRILVEAPCCVGGVVTRLPLKEKITGSYPVHSTEV